MIDTKDRLLDAAERAFSEYGYTGVSLRSIIGEAGVNLAAVHYHFGSKEGLLKAVILRRVGPVNVERLAMLDACERAAGAGRLEVEKVLEAFLVPTFRMARQSGGDRVVRLAGRLYVEDVLPRLVEAELGPVGARFESALRRALPELPPLELRARIHLAIGAMAQALRGAPYLPRLSEADEAEAAVERLVAFLGAGFRAPVGALAGREA
jgi:AcrR family transcriptional regulator